ncbi:hypothetical protein ElyMa_005527700 [Elysia marginata]|uniref:Uncharacterized protein n=1 Tax=Elysia marginata TaxID=1093978 RepID=A0AAV4EXK6_9GAST|nr:hypothetical protein ElyMa_005527700 [Elysia marginata]
MSRSRDEKTSNMFKGSMEKSPAARAFLQTPCEVRSDGIIQDLINDGISKYVTLGWRNNIIEAYTSSLRNLNTVIIRIRSGFALKPPRPSAQATELHGIDSDRTERFRLSGGRDRLARIHSAGVRIEHAACWDLGMLDSG